LSPRANREYPFLSSQFAALMRTLRETEAACKALGISWPENLSGVCDVVRVPDLNEPSQRLLWPELAPLPSFAATMPPALVLLEQERGEQARRAGEQARRQR
jgi:hypothetical protein